MNKTMLLSSLYHPVINSINGGISPRLRGEFSSSGHNSRNHPNADMITPMQPTLNMNYLVLEINQ